MDVHPTKNGIIGIDPYPNVVILPAKSASVNPCAAEKPGNTGPKDLVAWDQGPPSAQQPTMGSEIANIQEDAC